MAALSLIRGYTASVLLHLLLVLPLRAAAEAGPYNFGARPPALALLAKRQQSGAGANSNLVLGPLPLVNGSPGVRLEIRDLQAQDPDCWELLILALSLMQWNNQTDPLSWYQVAGIHNLPAQPWGNVLPVAGNEGLGYCHHSSILFCTWHRPYLALFEQILWHWAQSIAATYPAPVQDRYQAAAQRLRVPYWDWAKEPPAGEDVLPPFMGASPEVDAAGPNGMQHIANPMFRYIFHPLDGKGFNGILPWSVWSVTKRTDDNSSAATSNNTKIAVALNSMRPSLAQRLYNLFSASKNFTTFTNDAWLPGNVQPGTGSYDSVESVHNSVHMLVGGAAGHMSQVPVAAFDPVFFWHHAMVDRLFCMWQVLNPTEWVPAQGTAEHFGSYTTQQGRPVDGSYPLTPFFYRTADPGSPSQGGGVGQGGVPGSFWTSDLARDPVNFGYTYPELGGAAIDKAAADPDARAKVVQSINQNYGQFSPASLVDAGGGDLGGSSGGGGAQGEPKAIKKPKKKGGNRRPVFGRQDQLSDPTPGEPSALNPRTPLLHLSVGGGGGGGGGVLSFSASSLSYPSGSGSSDDAPDHPRLLPPPGTVLLDAHNRTYREWAVEVVADKLALGGPWQLFFFCGDAPVAAVAAPQQSYSPASAFAAAPNLVGSFANFAMASPFGGRVASYGGGDGAAPAPPSVRRISGAVPLTSALVRLIADPPAGMPRLRSLRAEHVTPFLRLHLKFKIVRAADGAVVDPDAVAVSATDPTVPAGGGKWLDMAVTGTAVTMPPRGEVGEGADGSQRAELPVWGEVVERWDLY